MVTSSERFVLLYFERVAKTYLSRELWHYCTGVCTAKYCGTAEYKFF